MKPSLSLVFCTVTLSLFQQTSAAAIGAAGALTVALVAKLASSYYQNPAIGDELVHYAQNGYVDALEDRLGNGYVIHPDTPSFDGTTALMHACIGSVDCLLSRGADINYRHKDNGRTPLMYQALDNHKEVIKALLEKKAGINAQDHKGQTALLMCLGLGEPRQSVTRLLLEQKADPNIATSSGQTALMKAVCWEAESSNISLTVDLIEAKASLDATDIKGKTALIKYVEHCNKNLKSVMDISIPYVLIKQHNANVNHQDVSGNTALMWAVQSDEYCHNPIIKSLLNYKADPAIPNNEKKTASQLASNNPIHGVAILSKFGKKLKIQPSIPQDSNHPKTKGME
jgi:ankyrin repeat protein